MVPFERLLRYKQRIIEAHWLHGRSTFEIAKWYKTGHLNVRRLLNEAGPGILNLHKHKRVDLREQQLKVCAEYGLDSARIRNLRYRKAEDRATREQSMITEYVDFKQSTEAVALFHNCTPMTVWRVLKRHNIRIRPKGRPRKEKSSNG